MATNLQGSAQLRARLKAIKETFRPIGRKWATSTTRHARTSAPGTCTCGTISRKSNLASLAASTRSFFRLLL